MYSFLNCSSINSYTSFFLLLTTNTFLFLSINPSFISHDLTSSHLLSSQKYESICGILKEPISWLSLLTLLLFLPYSKSPILLSSFSPPSSFLFFIFSSFSFLYFFFFFFSLFCSFCFCFFLSSSFCFCYSNFLCFDLYYFSHLSGHLIIFTSSVFQLISKL